MTKTTFVLCVLAMCPIASLADYHVSREEGRAAEQGTALFPDATPIEIELGAMVRATCELRLRDFVGSPAIIANPHLANPTGKPIRVDYHVSFFDEEGRLVGCASQSATVRAGAKDHQLASCIVRGPASELKRIYAYQVVLYEQEEEEPAQ